MSRRGIAFRSGVACVLAFATVTAPNCPTAAAAFLGDWVEIGTDAGPPVFDQLNATVAFNSDRGEYLVVWHNERTTYPDIQAQRVDPFGHLIGGPFYIAGGAGFQRRYPDVVYNPLHQEYLVVWEELPDGGRSNVYARRVDGDGMLLGSATALGSGPELASCMAPAVAWASTADLYMVVWERAVQGALSSDIEAQVLSGTGTTVGGNILVASGTINVHHEDPDIAYNRSRNEHLIVWTRTDSGSSVNIDIVGRIVTRDGALLGSELLIGYHTVDEDHAAVAGAPVVSGNGSYYVVWEAHYTAADHDIYGREVAWDGGLNAVTIITEDTVSDTDPCVAYDEPLGLFFVAWSRIVNPSVGMRDVLGFPYLPGAAQGPLESFMGGWSYPMRPAIATGSPGELLLAWDDAPYVPDRDLYGRAWSFYAIFVDDFESGGLSHWSASVP